MDAGDAIAAYAAVVATLAALWQVIQARRARRPAVEVALSPVVWDEDHERARGVLVELRNHGTIMLYMHGVGLTDGRAQWTFQPGQLAVGPLGGPRIELHLTDKLPRELPPKDTVPLILPERFVELGKDVGALFGSPAHAAHLDLDIERPLQAWVWLATGETVTTRALLDWSEPLMLGRNRKTPE